MIQLLRLESFLGLRLTAKLPEALMSIPAFDTGMMEKLIFRPIPGRKPFSIAEDENWKLLKFVPAKFNRLVVYPTWQIHSVIDELDPEILTVENMRLTMNQFVEYPLSEGIAPSKLKYPRHFYRSIAGLRSE
jgi:hypothetical protein